MRLIDGDALVKEISVSHTMTDDCGIKTGYEISMRLVEDAPTIEPRPRGQWINHRKDRGHNIADCDQCGGTLQWLDPDERPNFCPNCGADMRGEQDATD